LTARTSLAATHSMLLTALAALVAACVVSLAVGTYPISLASLFSLHLNETEQSVLTTLRAPRVLAALAAGAVFGVAGAAMQSLFRNPLAEPGLLGVPTAAALGAAVSLVVLSAASSLALWPGALIGAAIAMFALLAFAQRQHHGSTAQLLLLGVAVNAACAAGLALVTSMASETQLRTLAFWMLGSFANQTWNAVVAMLVVALIAMAILARDARALGALALGERTARMLGVSLRGLRLRVAIVSAFAVAIVTAFCGSVAFVGLAAPHIARMLVGSQPSRVLPLSAIIGALLCVLADIAARALAAPVELPVGAITSVIGVPVLIALVLRNARYRECAATRRQSRAHRARKANAFARCVVFTRRGAGTGASRRERRREEHPACGTRRRE
jgi:iron complex transport system permease protein